MIDSLVDEIGYNADSASWNQRIDALSGSVAVNTGSLLTTASFNNSTRNLTFTKGDSSQFSVNIPDVSGSVLPSGVVSGSSQINYPQISNIPAGIVSGSSQLTSSYDLRYVLSGSVQPLPSGTISGSSQITALGFVSSSITGSSVITASFSGNTLTFTKGDNSTFGVVIPDVSGSTINTGSFATTGSNNFIGNQTITGSLSVSETIKSQVYINPQTISGFTIPTGNNAMLVGPVAVSGSIVVEGNSNLIVLSQVTSSSTPLPSGVVSGSSQLTSSYDLRYTLSGSVQPLPSGVVSGSSQLTSSYDLRYALSGSGGGTIATGSFATTGSNNFIGNQTITGSLSVSSSVDKIILNGPNDSNFSPGQEGGVVVKNSFSVMGDTRLEGAVRFTGQLDVAKIVGTATGNLPGLGNQLNLVTNMKIFDDSNPANPRFFSLSGSADVSQSLSVGGDLNVGNNLIVSGNQQFNVGTFLSNVSQSGSANVSQSMNFETTDISDGVYIGITPSQIYCTNRGTYNIQFSAQIIAAGGADDIYIWLKKNGTNVPATAGHIQLGNNEEIIAAWNYVVDSVPNDYFEIVWQATNASTILLREAASGNIPSVPSVILTVTQVR